MLTQLEGEIFIAKRDISMFTGGLEELDAELDEYEEDKDETDKKLEVCGC